MTLESGPNAVTVEFHPRLTLIAGVAKDERSSLIGEIVGALEGTRRNTRLLVAEDSGRELLLIRGAIESDDKVIDVATQNDITATFAQRGASLDFLNTYRIGSELIRLKGQINREDMSTKGARHGLMMSLARQDQDTLWIAADNAVGARDQFKTSLEAYGAGIEDGPFIEDAERRRKAFEDAKRRHESIRHHGIFTAVACAFAAIPAALLTRWTALVFLATAAVTTIVSMHFRRRVAAAKRAKVNAFEAAGAKSYIGFHGQRVAELLERAEDRERIAKLATRNREASETWSALAGEADAHWAMTVKAQIIELSERIDPASDVQDHALPRTDEPLEPAELARTLIERLTQLRRAGANGESLPLILEEPFAHLDEGIKTWMLELISRAAGLPQIVYLTADPVVAKWGREQSSGGQMSVLEPMPEREVNEAQSTPA